MNGNRKIALTNGFFFKKKYSHNPAYAINGKAGGKMRESTRKNAPFKDLSNNLQ